MKFNDTLSYWLTTCSSCLTVGFIAWKASSWYAVDSLRTLDILPLDANDCPVDWVNIFLGVCTDCFFCVPKDNGLILLALILLVYCSCTGAFTDAELKQVASMLLAVKWEIQSLFINDKFFFLPLSNASWPNGASTTNELTRVVYRANWYSCYTAGPLNWPNLNINYQWIGTKTLVILLLLSNDQNLTQSTNKLAPPHKRLTPPRPFLNTDFSRTFDTTQAVLLHS